jgi:hypothetical protein
MCSRLVKVWGDLFLKSKYFQVKIEDEEGNGGRNCTGIKGEMVIIFLFNNHMCRWRHRPKVPYHFTLTSSFTREKFKQISEDEDRKKHGKIGEGNEVGGGWEEVMGRERRGG